MPGGPVFARAATAVVTTAAATSAVVALTLLAGETGVILFNISGGAGTLAGWTVTGISGGGTWKRAVRSADGTDLNRVVEIWTTPPAAAVATTSATVTFTRSDSTGPAVVLGCAYTGVRDLGATATNNIDGGVAPATSFSVARLARDPYNVVIAGLMYSNVTGVSAVTAVSGTIRAQGDDGGANSVDVAAAFVEGSSTSGGTTVTNTVSSASAAGWEGAALELRGTPLAAPAMSPQPRRG